MSYFYNIIIAILKQAKIDYIRALVKNDFYQINELEKFFLSDYGQAMSFNNGERIIAMCKKEAERRKRRRKQERKNGC